MKIITTLLLIFIAFNFSAQDYYFINAKSGLNVRADSNLSSPKVAKIPFGVMVEKIADTNQELIINDNGKEIKGKWVKIKYDNYLYLVSKETKSFDREGDVFDGFLKEIKTENLINTTKIDKEVYVELLKKAPPKNYHPKKIGNLYSIKLILKNRVEWVTEFGREENERDDVIKSITTKNGQTLIFNESQYEYAFEEGWSGYYPEEDILVLVGGHSSDMPFLIGTGETNLIGNPRYAIPSPKNNYRLNGYFGGQECTYNFIQKKENGNFIYLTDFSLDADICTFKDFYWLSENEFIYSKMNYRFDSKNGVEEYFKGEITK